jgi:hypothetical protein
MTFQAFLTWLIGVILNAITGGGLDLASLFGG